MIISCFHNMKGVIAEQASRSIFSPDLLAYWFVECFQFMCGGIEPLSQQSAKLPADLFTSGELWALQVTRAISGKSTTTKYCECFSCQQKWAASKGTLAGYRQPLSPTFSFPEGVPAC